MNRSVLKPATAFAVATTLLCAGCAPSVEVKSKPDDKSLQCVPAGDAVNKLKITGEHSGEVKIEGGTPISPDKQQTLVLDKGDGKKLEKGARVNIALSVFNGKDGSVLSQKEENVMELNDDTPAALGQAVGCASVHGRIVSAVKVSQAFDEKVKLPQGLTRDDSLILVIDINDPVLKKAEGEKKPAPAGFPIVTLKEDGSPEIKMPEGVKAPEKLSIATLIEGKGEEVKPGDDVYVNYRGVIWRTGEEFDSSWKRGAPVNFKTNQVIGGFTKALEGHKVGSQVIAVVPANDGGYGPDALKQQGHQPDDVMVFVLDILSTKHAS